MGKQETFLSIITHSKPDFDIRAAMQAPYHRRRPIHGETHPILPHESVNIHHEMETFAQRHHRGEHATLRDAGWQKSTDMTTIENSQSTAAQDSIEPLQDTQSNERPAILASMWRGPRARTQPSSSPSAVSPTDQITLSNPGSSVPRPVPLKLLQAERSQQTSKAPSLLANIMTFRSELKRHIVDIISRSTELDKLMRAPHTAKTLVPKNMTDEAQIFGSQALLRQQTEDIQTIGGILTALTETFTEASRIAEELKDEL